MAHAELTVPVHARDPYKDKKSIEFSFRARRFQEIRRIMEEILEEKGSCHVLDLGGSEKYWLIGEDFIKANRERLHFTIINPEPQESTDTGLFSFSVGDATDPDLFKDQSFDLVHSNSVIEHVGNWDAIQRFADNTRRLGKRYFMQTPNFWFPYEPHFRFPGFQWLPASLRALMMTKMKLGFFAKQETYAEAKCHVDSIRLLSAGEIHKLLPDATIKRERIFGMAKSIMAIR
ncbi:MAG: class I SAM-dependent methyltransferase [Rhizobiaceae bacterium]